MGKKDPAEAVIRTNLPPVDKKKYLSQEISMLLFRIRNKRIKCFIEPVISDGKQIVLYKWKENIHFE